MTSAYLPGDRVWLFKDDKQTWWPGRVLSTNELTRLAYTRAPGCDVAVGLYFGEEVEDNWEASFAAKSKKREVVSVYSTKGRVMFFETSSEKAVTSDSLLKQAMANALSDSTANPLKTDQELLSIDAAAAASSSGKSKSAMTSAGRLPQTSPAGKTFSPSSLPSHKRRRPQEDGESAGGLGGSSKGGVPTLTYASDGVHSPRRVGTADLITLAHALGKEEELIGVRRLLARLDRVDVPPEQLEESKIGVAVGNLLGKETFRPIWPLAKAIVSFWARHLPKETLAGIQKIKNTTADNATMMPPIPSITSASPHTPFSPPFPPPSSSTFPMYDVASFPTGRASGHPPPGSSGVDVAALVGGSGRDPTASPLPFLVPSGAPTLRQAGNPSTAALSSPLGSFTPSFLTAEATNGLQGAANTGNRKAGLAPIQTNLSLYTSPTTTGRSMGFSHHVAAALESALPRHSETNAPAASRAVLERVTQELVKGIVQSEDRQLFLSRIRDPELSELREKLLSGEWDAATYLRQGEEVFTTQSEKEAERKRVQEALDAQHQATMSTMNETSLFTCENCGKKRCRYYEQQTRGGDEPSTKFITCLECNITWTQE